MLHEYGNHSRIWVHDNNNNKNFIYIAPFKHKMRLKVIYIIKNTQLNKQQHYNDILCVLIINYKKLFKNQV